jgi:hypothetical protein
MGIFVRAPLPGEEGVKQAEKTVVLATLEKFDSKFDFPPPIPINS